MVRYALPLPSAAAYSRESVHLYNYTPVPINTYGGRAPLTHLRPKTEGTSCALCLFAHSFACLACHQDVVSVTHCSGNRKQLLLEAITFSSQQSVGFAESAHPRRRTPHKCGGRMPSCFRIPFSRVAKRAFGNADTDGRSRGFGDAYAFGLNTRQDLARPMFP